VTIAKTRNFVLDLGFERMIGAHGVRGRLLLGPPLAVVVGGSRAPPAVRRPLRLQLRFAGSLDTQPDVLES
jgi:hypothetical protein